MVSKTFMNNYKSEYIQFLCLTISVIITNIIDVNFLKYYIIQFTANSFEINTTQIDNEFFYMLSFLIQFSIIYSLTIFIIKSLKNVLLAQSLKNNPTKYQSAHRIAIIVSSFIRAITILSILIFTLESFPFDINESENKIMQSKTYHLISRLADFIIT